MVENKSMSGGGLLHRDRAEDRNLFLEEQVSSSALIGEIVCESGKTCSVRGSCEFRNRDEFSQLEARQDDLPTEAGEVVFVGSPDALDEAMFLLLSSGLS